MLSYTQNFVYDLEASQRRRVWKWLMFCLGVTATALFVWPKNMDYVEYGGLILTPIISIAASLISTDTRLSLMSLNIEEKRNRKFVLHHFIQLVQLIDACGEPEDTGQNRLLELYVTEHQRKCLRPRCPLVGQSSSSPVAGKGGDSVSGMLTGLKFAVALHMREAITLFPADISLKILYVQFIRKHIKSYLGAWTMINSILKGECNFVQRLQIYAFK